MENIEEDSDENVNGVNGDEPAPKSFTDTDLVRFISIAFVFLAYLVIFLKILILA
jgi:hypothetical protein